MPRPPSLSLVVGPAIAAPQHTPLSQHTPSTSSFRYLRVDPALASPRHVRPRPIQSSSSTPSHSTPFLHSRSSSSRIYNRLKPWIPILAYASTSIGFLIAIAFYKTEVFARLDDLSRWLRADPRLGYSVLFGMIFLTTIPPFPLYSTLIILSGYTFGPWAGAAISYAAALTGALVVFGVSRSLFRDAISRWLESTRTMKRVVRAIEKRPKLLFLIRVAPYPYNVMNCLLAASPTLSLKTYTICTALSLFKVIIHTSLGSTIHSFKDFHTVPNNGTTSEETHVVARTWAIVGILLCVAIFVYLAWVARKAVDEELQDEVLAADEEETLTFLPHDSDNDIEAGRRQSVHVARDGPAMVESPLRLFPLTLRTINNQ